MKKIIPFVIIAFILGLFIFDLAWAANIQSFAPEKGQLGKELNYQVEARWQVPGHKMAEPAAYIEDTGNFSLIKTAVHKLDGEDYSVRRWNYQLLPLAAGQVKLPRVQVVAVYGDGINTADIEGGNIQILSDKERAFPREKYGAWLLFLAIVTAIYWWYSRRKKRCILNINEIILPAQVAKNALNDITKERLMNSHIDEYGHKLHHILICYLQVALKEEISDRKSLIELMKKKGFEGEKISVVADTISQLNENRFSGIYPDEIKAGELEAKIAKAIEIVDILLGDKNE